MEQPTLSMAANIRWTKSGVVWADYVLTGIDYGYRPDVDKRTARTLHTMLVRALPGESLLMGIAASLSAEAVVSRMTEGVDLDAHPDWATECEATLDSIELYRPGQRIYWLSIPLTTPKVVDQVKAAAHSAWTTLSDYIGLPRTAIDDDEIRARVRQANRIMADIPGVFDAQPATPAQMVWLWQHAMTRGLHVDPDLPDAAVTPGAKSGAALSACRIDEGAQSDREKASGWRGKVPTFSRVLKVDQPYEFVDHPASYQVLLALADTPAGGVYFPGSEFFTLADDFGDIDVDFAVRLKVTAGADVMRANKRALENLKEQYEQREGELAGGQGVLDLAAAALTEYTSLLETNRDEVEVAWTALFAVGADSEERALADAKALVKAFEQQEYKVVAPVGYQEDLWWAMLPGVPTSKIVREFAQITTSTHFAAYMPFIRNDLGDGSGPLLALNITTSRIGVVHHDVAGKSLRDQSGSFAVTGELGSGKSVTMKVIAGQVVDCGGQVIGIDQSDLGEYANWAKAVTEAVVVDLVEPEYSMDPLRIFEAGVAAEMAQSVLLTLLRIQPSSDLGIALAKVLEPEYRAEHPYQGLGELTEHLLSGACPIAHAQDLGEAMNVYARRTYAAVLFGKDLPPLPITAPGIIFRTHKVDLPTQLQTEKQHLYENLPLEKRFGHAVYTLIAKVARGQCFADPDQMALFLVDEAHHLLGADDGVDIVEDFVLQGRKSSAAVGLGDQDCAFGTPKLRGLIKTRIAHRHTDETLAKRAIEWLGLDPDDYGLVKQYMEQTAPVTGKDKYVEPHRRGEGYMRDGSGNVGRIKTLLPATESRRSAVSTTPKDNKLVKA
ncbi:MULTISPECIES: ATP-binding protein [unclassified Rhodococcus (in: high G+C Gram-positive bacteria)]|uniref:AAA-like domain-containing protein n=1 Tax=Rhodococcus jostii (strain RHA1) TaxID=101510 RepID=Q0RWW7_RHOJR|nr:ATP-binding protein [Rhodococcus sp. DK17]ABH00219.1 conserved hypothetical protein [Rhodococcus jostii RHA1]